MAYIGSKPANKPVVASDLDPTVITGQTALAVAPAATDEFLVSDAGTLKRLDASLIGETNTPLFRAYIASSDQTIPHSTWTKVRFDTETFDPSGVYDHSTNYRFTPAVAGYYSITAQVTSSDVSDWNTFALRIYKNGSAITDMQVRHTHADSIFISTMDLSDDNDYYEIFVRQNSGSNKDIRNLDSYNWFQAFKVAS